MTEGLKSRRFCGSQTSLVKGNGGRPSESHQPSDHCHGKAFRIQHSLSFYSNLISFLPSSVLLCYPPVFLHLSVSGRYPCFQLLRLAYLHEPLCFTAPIGTAVTPSFSRTDLPLLIPFFCRFIAQLRAHWVIQICTNFIVPYYVLIYYYWLYFWNYSRSVC